MKRPLIAIFSALAVIVLVTGYYAYRYFNAPASRTQRVLAWLRDPNSHSDWTIKANQRCSGAPFSLPTDGYIGYLWGDHFNINHKHQGVDIFAGASAGVTAVYSVFNGYLTRQSDWKSSVIIRIPDDPLSPGRQIWIYFTHMADRNGQSFISDAFPPGTHELFIPEGTLLGYQGNYSGDAGHPTGVHLHISIVLSDTTGQYKNELDISNTLDPSPYFGLPLNGEDDYGEIPVCTEK
jgi:hypothetical protein